MGVERVTRRKLLASATAVGSAVAAGCLGDSTFGADGETIRAPARTRVGDPVRVRIAGFEPDAAVTLDAVAADTGGRVYGGSWSLRTNDDGTAALSRGPRSDDTPRSVWYGSDPGRRVAERAAVRMVLRRLSPVGFAPSPPSFVAGNRNVVELALRVRSGPLGRTDARDAQSRVLVHPEVSRRRVEADGLVGWLYEPPTRGPHPGVVTFHGALAAVPHRLSRMLATHGYLTLALQYSDAPGLPDSVLEVPVEYFGRAVRWLTNRGNVRDDGVGLVGVSRGVEAALLTAVDRDGPTTVVGYSGGGIVGRGVVGTPPRVFADRRPAWTRDGDPVAAADPVDDVFDALEDAASRRCDPESILRSAGSSVPAAALDRALIPVERIDGPVLLVAGGDDRQWPSIPSAALTIRRLERRGHPHPYGLRAYCDAGHVFGVPYADYAGGATSDENGGTPGANARAAADSWPLALDYLAAGLGDESGE